MNLSGRDCICLLIGTRHYELDDSRILFAAGLWCNVKQYRLEQNCTTNRNGATLDVYNNIEVLISVTSLSYCTCPWRIVLHIRFR